MKPSLSAASLLTILHQYYPSGLWCDEPAYKASAEAQRLTRRLQDAQNDTPPWKDFVSRVGKEFSDCELWDTSLPWIDPCYRLRLSLPDTEHGSSPRSVLVCLVSLLAPAYVLYASRSQGSGSSWTCYPPLPPELQAHEVRLAALVESSLGVTCLSREVLFTSVPELAPRTGNVALGKAHLVDLLFTPDRW